MTASDFLSQPAELMVAFSRVEVYWNLTFYVFRDTNTVK